MDVPEEVNDRTEAIWLYKLGLLLRYIDDGFSLTRVNFENSFGMEVNGIKYRVKHAVQAQNIFRHLVRKAEDGIRDFCLSRGLGDVYKRQVQIRTIVTLY